MLELRRWNTPTIYNGWEQITAQDSSRDGFNIEETIDFMPQMGPMVGRAITVVVEPGNKEHPVDNPNAWSEYRRYVASIPGPKIVVVQDFDKPQAYGAFWGEVNSTMHRALGCVGTIADGGIRDLDEMITAGFKALARRLCVGHARSFPVRWGIPVEVFGTHGRAWPVDPCRQTRFSLFRSEEEERLLEAARFMDSQECQTMIAAARGAVGISVKDALARLDEASSAYRAAVQSRYRRRGEF